MIPTLYAKYDMLLELYNIRNNVNRDIHLNINNFQIDKFSSECKELYEKEKNLKFKYAKRLAREPLPNIYKMHSEIGSGDQESWTIIRKDLKPTIEQDAGCKFFVIGKPKMMVGMRFRSFLNMFHPFIPPLIIILMEYIFIQNTN